MIRGTNLKLRIIVTSLLIVTMRISKPSGGDIPEPFNENDVVIFDALIAKFLCQTDVFLRNVFLQMLIDNKIKASGGYPIKGKREALDNIDHSINELIDYCIKLLIPISAGPATRAAWDRTTAPIVSQKRARTGRIREPSRVRSGAGRPCSRSC